MLLPMAAPHPVSGQLANRCLRLNTMLCLVMHQWDPLRCQFHRFWPTQIPTWPSLCHPGLLLGNRRCHRGTAMDPMHRFVHILHTRSLHTRQDHLQPQARTAHT